MPNRGSSPEQLGNHQPELQRSAGSEAAPEKYSVPEGEPRSAATPPTMPSPVVPTLPVPTATPGVIAASGPISANPIAANDDDVIEKDWVERAKKIVAQTQNNPYEQEKEVSKLQADYIKKRYGKDIKLPED